ncbi:MAG: hypothetical protein WA765_08640 [Candidatus Acidiferrum sp.]
MNRIWIALTVAFLTAVTARAQSEVKNLPLSPIEPPQVNLLQLSAKQSPSRILPDDPIPVLPSLQDGPAPCPGGNGKSCALLGGRLYFSDPFRMTEHDATWVKAMTNPAMMSAFVLTLASTVADLEGTQACLHAHTCREANPIYGHDPTRERAYGTAIPVDLLSFVGAGLMKKNGKGNFAFGFLSAVTAVHIYFASSGFAAAHGTAATNSAAATRQRLALSIRF